MRRLFLFLALMAATIPVGACDFVGDVIEFTFWTTVILIGLLILLVWLVVRTLRGRNRREPPPRA